MQTLFPDPTEFPNADCDGDDVHHHQPSNLSTLDLSQLEEDFMGDQYDPLLLPINLGERHPAMDRPIDVPFDIIDKDGKTVLKTVEIQMESERDDHTLVLGNPSVAAYYASESN